MNIACPDTTHVVIRRAASAAWAEAAELLVSTWPDGARQQQHAALLELFTSTPPAPLDLFVAYRGDGRVTGAVMGMAARGGVAVVWPPQVQAGELPAVASELHDVLCASLTAQGVEVVQAALHPHDQTSCQWLERHGYLDMADLLYLRAPIDGCPPAPATAELSFTPWDVREPERLERVVEATYEATLDCPRLDGWRRTSDVLAGYRATGDFHPSRWLLVQSQGEDIGCLLLTDHPELDGWEMLYMGLAAPWRRRGWGARLVEHARRCAAHAGRQQLLLAVDRLNEPALRIYRRAGFTPWARRKILARRVAETALAPASVLAEPLSTPPMEAPQPL